MYAGVVPSDSDELKLIGDAIQLDTARGELRQTFKITDVENVRGRGERTQ